MEQKIPFGTLVSFYFHTVLNLHSVFFQFSLLVQQLTEIQEKEEFLKGLDNILRCV